MTYLGGSLGNCKSHRTHPRTSGLPDTRLAERALHHQGSRAEELKASMNVPPIILIVTVVIVHVTARTAGTRVTSLFMYKTF